MKKVGLFGGTFDPIHNGHIFLALQLMEMNMLDEVIFCPAFLSPFKKEKPPSATSEDRFRMVQLAIEGISGFTLTDIEIKRSQPSYTIDTIRSLQKNNPKIQYRLLFAEETLWKLDEWKDVNSLLEIAPPLIGGREGSFETHLQNLPSSLQEMVKGNYFLTKKMDISSTEIRARIPKKMYCGHLTSQKVLDYIYRNNLYL
ncbi:MAG: nicotinate-nucleotide adenylyltransferase [Chlamydiota bacterium]